MQKYNLFPLALPTRCRPLTPPVPARAPLGHFTIPNTHSNAAGLSTLLEPRKHIKQCAQMQYDYH
jgi:hypothetical protein